MPRIKLGHIANQWRHAPHDIQVNCWNFEVEAARIATAHFKESFTKNAFNDTRGARWPKRSPNYHASHPLLRETRTLYRSITWEHQRRKGAKVWTDPSKFSTTKRHRGFCFAAVHNEGLPFTAFGKKPMNMPKRQFIGDSKSLERKLDRIIPLLFKHLPH